MRVKEPQRWQMYEPLNTSQKLLVTNQGCSKVTISKWLNDVLMICYNRQSLQVAHGHSKMYSSPTPRCLFGDVEIDICTNATA